MGSIIKHNAVLKLTYTQGMPKQPQLGEEYSFTLKGLRIFQLYPSALTLVHELDGKWKYIGLAQINCQTIDAKTETTTGIFVIIRLFDQEFSKLASINEAPEGKSYY